MRVLSLSEKGREILAWILLEEAQHFSPDGIIFKSHPENKEKVFEQTNDYLKMVEHGAIFRSTTSVLDNIINAAHTYYPDLNSVLRNHSIQRLAKPEMLLLEDCIKYFLDTNIRFYLENPSIPLDNKIMKLKKEIVPIMNKYMPHQDAKSIEFTKVIIGSIAGYSKYYLEKRANSINFERGYEAAYLKSA